MNRTNFKNNENKVLPMTVVLVGLMGAGKTSVGRRLAERLKVSFIDADHEIERAAGCSVTDFFEKFGEKEFREGEKRVITRLLNLEPCILATGGGAYMASETRELIKKKAVSLWIRADLDVLNGRLARRSGRPLLQTNDPRATIKKLMETRYPIYAEADITVESPEVPVEITVNAVYSVVAEYFSLNKGP
jgi:shikimate kinase